MAHVALLGDSILDNGAYTRGEPDVAAHLRAILPAAWTVTLCAVDGATTQGLPPQLARVPADATHLVLAIGGNDALGNADLLDLPVRSTAEALALFAERLARFHRSYTTALDAVLARHLPTTVCTVYNGRLEEPQATLARVALTTFNDVILTAAVERDVDIIELRLVCREPADYANPIEPSGRGGRKIAAAIARAVGAGARDPQPARVYRA